MNITEKLIEDITKDREDKEEINIISFYSFNINKILLNETKFDNIEYLCLKNNQIKDISFIVSFPFLWYFDIRDNFVINFIYLGRKF